MIGFSWNSIFSCVYTEHTRTFWHLLVDNSGVASGNYGTLVCPRSTMSKPGWITERISTPSCRPNLKISFWMWSESAGERCSWPDTCGRPSARSRTQKGRPSDIQSTSINRHYSCSDDPSCLRQRTKGPAKRQIENTTIVAVAPRVQTMAPAQPNSLDSVSMAFSLSGARPLFRQPQEPSQDSGSPYAKETSPGEKAMRRTTRQSLSLHFVHFFVSFQKNSAGRPDCENKTLLV